MKTVRQLLFGLLCVVLLTGCEIQKEQSGQETWSREVFAMDTYMKLTVYGANAENAVDAAILEIQRLENLLSAADPESEVSVLNREKKGVLSEESTYLWEKSWEVYLETQGKFDVTIYPVMKAWGFVGEEFHIPEEGLLNQLTNEVNASLVEWNKENSEISLPDRVELDFGAIAKGYTGARLAEQLKKQGIKSALLNLGGNIQLVGNKPDDSPFRIGVKDPDGTAEYLCVLSVADTAVVTSGDYERYFEQDGVRYHHIIDPDTGYPADKGLRSVTIVCRDGTLADAYSTALFVMGTEEAIRFWESHSKQFDAVLYTEDGRLLVTEGLQDLLATALDYEVLRVKE